MKGYTIIYSYEHYLKLLHLFFRKRYRSGKQTRVSKDKSETGQRRRDLSEIEP